MYFGMGAHFFKITIYTCSLRMDFSINAVSTKVSIKILMMSSNYAYAKEPFKEPLSVLLITAAFAAVAV